jgi:hypothetical protein
MHLEATAIQVTLADRPVRKISFTFRSEHERQFRRGNYGPDGRRTLRQTRGLELAADHEKGKLLRDYADKNSFLIFGPDTNPYNPSATPDVLHIVITQKLTFQVYVTSCSALSSDPLLVMIDIACRSFYQHPPHRPDFRRSGWAKIETHLEDTIQLDAQLHNGMANVR